MEVGEFCGLSSEVFKRTVVPLYQSGREDMEEVAEQEAALDEAFHWSNLPRLRSCQNLSSQTVCSREARYFSSLSSPHFSWQALDAEV